MTLWQPYLDDKNPEQHTVVGALRIAKEVYSPQLKNKRDLLVYLPPSYHHTDRAYPVLYMHDGQNLFDAATSHVGEWRVDETMEQLATESIEVIVVGIPNAGKHRIEEYSPFPTRYGRASGDAYLRFIVETVKPLIDDSFRTLPDRAHTGIAGSSMGGLISLYGFFRHPGVFGLAGVMSPAFWIAGTALTDFITQAPNIPGRLYLDIGSKEISRRRNTGNLRLMTSVRKMYYLLVEKGYRPEENVVYIEEADGEHHEAAWARRLPQMMRFLFAPQPIPQ